jgi:uncharacterized protein
MKVNDLVAVDVHTHAEVSCRQPADAFWQPYEDAANEYRIRALKIAAD